MKHPAGAPVHLHGITSHQERWFGRRALLAGAAGAAGLLASGCSGFATVDMLVSRQTYTGREGLAYGPLPRQKLDVFRPLGAAAGAPLCLFFYGGAWTHGERANYRFVGEALASHGIVALVADYRLSPEVRWRDILADCALATAWAHQNALSLGADPKRIHLMGHSAGAYNAAMLALDARWLARHGLAPRQLAGWVGIAGPYDFLPIGDRNTRVAFDWPDTPPESQPIVHVAAGAPRALLLAPEIDGTVNPRRNTQQLSERLRAVGVPVRTRLYEGVSHVTIVGALATPLMFLAPVRSDVIAFCGGRVAV